MTDQIEETPVETPTEAPTETPVETPAEQPKAQETPELNAHQQFLEMLPEDLRENPAFMDFKGETMDEVLGKLGKSYVNTKKLVGADKNALLKIPASEDDTDGWSEVYTKLGRPEDPKGYELDKYKEVPGVQEEELNQIAEVAHKHGVSKQAMGAILETYFAQADGMQAKSEEEVNATLDKYNDDLKREWGQAFENKTNKVLSTLKEKADPAFLELAKDYPFIFDHPAVMKTMDSLIAMSSEDDGIQQGGSAQGFMTPAEAKAALNAMEGDKQKMDILLTSGHPQRESLLAERRKLFEAAYG